MSIAHRFLPVKSGFPVIFLHFFPFSLILHYALCGSYRARQNDPSSPATLLETVLSLRDLGEVEAICADPGSQLSFPQDTGSLVTRET